ncbi:hypothetical protein Anas_03680 [Armadillidium nasatum]|uniref:Uncharacterized protein n=1 Tax=Armadillidium nasatum TaxID=96803 RepID=A0A5N5SSZ2_9CRUS|nr:hypothetical protein Anas_03680 [Armadillidium nasatum]
MYVMFKNSLFIFTVFIEIIYKIIGIKYKQILVITEELSAQFLMLKILVIPVFESILQQYLFNRISVLKITCLRIFLIARNIVIPALNVNHVREMSRVKQRFTMPPFWHPKKRVICFDLMSYTLFKIKAYPETLTTENQEFIKEHVKTRYSSPLKGELFEKGEWEPNSYRCGLISKKIGVLPFWLKSGKRVASTLLHF